MKEENSGLTERRKTILLNAIDDYINFVNPITSGRIFNALEKKCSTATLRNELNTLEAMGYFKQIYTSGGRVPTTKGYRFYVDALLQQANINTKNLVQVKEVFKEKNLHLNDILEKLTTKISEVTNYPTVFALNGYGKLIIDSVKIIPLISLKGIVLISTNNGIVDTTLELKEGISDTACLEAGQMLTRNYSGKTIDDMVSGLTSLQKQIDEFENLFDCVLEGLLKIVDKHKIIKKGTQKLLDEPEYNSIESAKNIINFMEDKERVEKVFSSDTNFNDEDIEIIIGKENEEEDLKGCSIIKANYNVDGENIASIGVIGPERLDYIKLASALKYIVGEIKTLNQLTNREEEDG